MNNEVIVIGCMIGVGATLVMDIWALLLNKLFKVPSLNYAMVGRWIGHLKNGKFTHQNIGKAEAISGEGIIGWTAHYLIGIVFAIVLLSVWSIEWAYHPTFMPALIIGLVTTAAPFFILQPGMGAGVAASKTPQPNIARVRSLNAHLSFGVGLYLAAIVASKFLF